jgi:hypothetical protein
VVDKMCKALFHQYDTIHDLDAVRNIPFLTVGRKLTLNVLLRYWTMASLMRR